MKERIVSTLYAESKRPRVLAVYAIPTVSGGS